MKARRTSKRRSGPNPSRNRSASLAFTASGSRSKAASALTRARMVGTSAGVASRISIFGMLRLRAKGPADLPAFRQPGQPLHIGEPEDGEGHRKQGHRDADLGVLLEADIDAEARCPLHHHEVGEAAEDQQIAGEAR